MAASSAVSKPTRTLGSVTGGRWPRTWAKSEGLNLAAQPAHRAKAVSLTLSGTQALCSLALILTQLTLKQEQAQHAAFLPQPRPKDECRPFQKPSNVIVLCTDTGKDTHLSVPRPGDRP